MSSLIKRIEQYKYQNDDGFFIQRYDDAEKKAIDFCRDKQRLHSADDIDRYLLTKDDILDLNALKIEDLVQLYSVLEAWAPDQNENLYKYAAIQQALIIQLMDIMQNKLRALGNFYANYLQEDSEHESLTPIEQAHDVLKKLNSPVRGPSEAPIETIGPKSRIDQIKETLFNIFRRTKDDDPRPGL